MHYFRPTLTSSMRTLLNLALTLILLPVSTTEATAQNGSDSQPTASGSYTITVSAGAMERSQSVVQVDLPDRVEDGVYRMVGEAGEELLFQVRDNRGGFLLEHLPA